MASQLSHIENPPARDFICGHSERHTADHDHHPRSMGFLLVCTDPSPAWDLALAKVKEYLWFNRVGGLQLGASVFQAEAYRHVSDLCFVVLDDEELRGADDATIRTYCRKWKDSHDQLKCFYADNVCLTMDESTVQANLDAPSANWDKDGSWPTNAEEIAVYLRMLDLDYTEPQYSSPYQEGPHYRGWARAAAMYLVDLYEDLQAREMSVYTPSIQYHGQIPVYDGDVIGRLLDPPGGTEGRLYLMGRDDQDDLWEQVHRIEREEREAAMAIKKDEPCIQELSIRSESSI